MAAILSEGLAPSRAAAAVFTGVFIGVVPIYGFQLLAAAGAAVVFRLNKPLTLAATFINNPLLQPFLVATSIGLGHLVLNGHYQVITESPFTAHGFTDSLWAWFTGSAILGVVLGGLMALGTFVAAGLGAEESRRRRARFRQVRGMYARAPYADRSFVRWKLRLDRVFEFLEAEDAGSGTVIDLGCGHGIASAFVASGSGGRRMLGCDLDGHRVAVAQQAFAGLDAAFQVEDVRRFALAGVHDGVYSAGQTLGQTANFRQTAPEIHVSPGFAAPLAPATLILILDVLQYLDREEQQELLGRCARALEPGGKLIFRVQDEDRGIYSRFSMGLDRIVFALGGAGRRPFMMTGEEYQRVLEDEGLDVRQVRFRNRLPLAHRLVIGVKGVGQADPEGTPPANPDQELAGESACPTTAGKPKHAPPKAELQQAATDHERRWSVPPKTLGGRP